MLILGRFYALATQLQGTNVEPGHYLEHYHSHYTQGSGCNHNPGYALVHCNLEPLERAHSHGPKVAKNTFSVQFRKMNMVPLKNKHYINKDALSGDTSLLKCCYSLD